MSASPVNTAFDGEFELIVSIDDEHKAIMCRLAVS
jgi:hypothetical protein